MLTIEKYVSIFGVLLLISSHFLAFASFSFNLVLNTQQKQTSLLKLFIFRIEHFKRI